MDTVGDLITTVFLDMHINYRNLNSLCERAILASKNTVVAKLNEDLHTYKSVDTVMDQEEAVNFHTEFPSSLEPSGLPPYQLYLEPGTPVMLLRNMEPSRMSVIISSRLFNQIVKKI